MTPTPTLTPEANAALSAFSSQVVAQDNVPVWFSGVATKDGVLHFSCAGRQDAVEDKGDVTEDTMIQLFSMTKLVTTLACLQLLESGKLSLDDPTVIEKHLPELASQPIMTAVSDSGEVTSHKRTKPLTVRHLLTHTAGLSYSFTSPLREKYERLTGCNTWASIGPDVGVTGLAQPLEYEPGDRYIYSTSLDWAGVLVERVSGLSLEEYFQQNIFAPAGIRREDLTFVPTQQVKERLMSMYLLDPSGAVVPGDGFRPIKKWTEEDVRLFLGGAGLIGTMKAYLTLLSAVLRCKDSKGIISPSSFESLFTSALPSRAEQPSIYKDLGGMAAFEGLVDPDQVDGSTISLSLGLMLFDKKGSHGRSAGSGFWSGAARTRYWIDPERGVVAACGTQLMEPDWDHVARIVDRFEEKVYAGLQ